MIRFFLSLSAIALLAACPGVLAVIYQAPNLRYISLNHADTGCDKPQQAETEDQLKWSLGMAHCINKARSRQLTI